MTNLLFIGNIEDQVTGAMHQVTLVEDVEDGLHKYTTRLNGTIIPMKHEFHLRVLQVAQSFTDHFAGLEDLDEYLISL